MTRPYDILLLDADNTLLDFSRSEKTRSTSPSGITG